MRRRYWILAVSIPLLFLTAETIYWRIAADRLRTGYQDWLAAQVERGWQIESGPISIGGWPAAAAVTVPNLALRHTGPTIPGEMNLACGGITLSVALFNPTALRLSLWGPVHLRAGTMPDVILTGDETLVSAPLHQQAAQLTITLHGRGLRLEAAAGTWHLTIGLLNAQAILATDSSVDQSRPAVTFTVVSEAIALPTVVKWPLGQNISSLSMDGRINGQLPGSRDITRWAEAWRDGGGLLEIKHLTMGWGPLGLTASATMALDDRLQPMGSGNARIVGYAQTLDRLAAAGLLTKSAATAAKAVLSLMAETTDQDQPSAVDVPLRLQYRTLSMHQVPLVRLPQLDWPTR